MPASNACRLIEDSPYPTDWSRPSRVRPRVSPHVFTSSFPSREPYDFQDAYHKTLTLVLKTPQPSISLDEAKFRRLVSEWHNETDMHSSTLKVIAHPAYLRIIAMGRSAIPLILREMKQGPGHWLPAISALTEDVRSKGENPASGCKTSSEARSAWVRWGESKGYL